MENELLNCPFCGGKASLAVRQFTDEMADTGNAWVGCIDCGVEQPWKRTKAEAIAAWNNRPQPEPVAWMPIESAPKDGSYMLLCFPGPFHDREFPGVAVGKAIDRDGGWWLTSGWAGTTAHQKPVGWMPLPAAPADTTTTSAVGELEMAIHTAMLELGSHGACPACLKAHSILKAAVK